ncbi:MAG: 6-phosphogluconolactonase [Acidimicrobiia bacterium]
MEGTIEVVPDVAQAFAALLVAEAPRSLALSGGDTARRSYELLVTADLDWAKVDVLFGDERWVPLGDPDSNEGMARVSFLDQVGPHEVHSMREAGTTPETAALAYDELLQGLPTLDVVHLGLGEDAHTASLFPGSPALDESARLVVATGDELHPHRRLTFTFPAIARSRLVVFTVSGPEKRDAFSRVRRDEPVPAARVRAERIVWLVDDAVVADS